MHSVGEGESEKGRWEMNFTGRAGLGLLLIVLISVTGIPGKPLPEIGIALGITALVGFVALCIGGKD